MHCPFISTCKFFNYQQCFCADDTVFVTWHDNNKLYLQAYSFFLFPKTELSKVLHSYFYGVYNSCRHSIHIYNTYIKVCVWLCTFSVGHSPSHFQNVCEKLLFFCFIFFSFFFLEKMSAKLRRLYIIILYYYYSYLKQYKNMLFSLFILIFKTYIYCIRYTSNRIIINSLPYVKVFLHKY